jgi:hypothetical protein
VTNNDVKVANNSSELTRFLIGIDGRVAHADVVVGEFLSGGLRQSGGASRAAERDILLEELERQFALDRALHSTVHRLHVHLNHVTRQDLQVSK